MSTDYQVFCHNCKVSRHLGQRFSSGYSFGYGSNDKETQAVIMEFIADHVEQGHALAIDRDEPDGYRWLDGEESPETPAKGKGE